jgi:hypothetical protein
MKRHTTSGVSRWLIMIVFMTSLMGANIGTAFGAGDLTLYPTEQRAQKHCTTDTVVWLNLPTGIYHFKGERWYGNTKSGAFVCEREADKAGDRATRNGQ